MAIATVELEWRGGTTRFSVFFGEQYIGQVKQHNYPDSCQELYDSGEDEYFAASIGGRELPGRFLYRGEAMAALVKEMRTEEMAAQLYVEV